VLLVKSDVFDTERAATDCVSLILILLVTGSECQLVDKVESHRSLPDSHLLGFEIWKKFDLFHLANMESRINIKTIEIWAISILF